MKKLFAVLLLLGLLVIVGCGSETEPQQTLQVRRFENRPGVGLTMDEGILPGDIAGQTQLVKDNGIAMQVVPVVQFNGQLLIENAPEISERSLGLYAIAPEHGFVFGEELGSLQDNVVYTTQFPHESIDLFLGVVTAETEHSAESAEGMNLSFPVVTSIAPGSLSRITGGVGEGFQLFGLVTMKTLVSLTNRMYGQEFWNLDAILARQGLAAPRIVSTFVHVDDPADVDAARRLLTDNGYDILS